MSETTTELIHRLREHAAWAAANEYETPICLGDDLRGAADLIESMQAQLAASHRRERAAVEDLEYACGSSGEFELRSICDICRRKQTDGTCPTQCEMNSLAASNKWQWRGLQDEEGAEK